MSPGAPYHRCVLEISYQLSRRSIAPTANTATMPANIAKSLPHIAAQLPPANMELVTHPLGICLPMPLSFVQRTKMFVISLQIYCMEEFYKIVSNLPIIK